MKFRVFDKYSKSYVNPNNVSIDGNGNLRVHFSSGFVHTDNDGSQYIVEMSTGLTALDGLEIYEGDILHFYSRNENFVVVYNKEFARFELRLAEFKENGIEVEDDTYYLELKDDLDLIHCEKTLSQERYA
jgi:hypothetical protein